MKAGTLRDCAGPAVGRWPNLLAQQTGNGFVGIRQPKDAQNPDQQRLCEDGKTVDQEGDTAAKHGCFGQVKDVHNGSLPPAISVFLAKPGKRSGDERGMDCATHTNILQAKLRIQIVGCFFCLLAIERPAPCGHQS
jgi:hypothetical protein